MRSATGPGARFPHYRLVDQGGTPRSLSELQGGDVTVLHLCRGATTRRNTDSSPRSWTPLPNSASATPVSVDTRHEPIGDTEGTGVGVKR